MRRPKPMRARRDSCPDERTCERAFARLAHLCRLCCVATRRVTRFAQAG
jgi:hypothetical protein